MINLVDIGYWILINSMINLVKNGYEEVYSEFIKKKYKQKFNINADIFNVEFSNGVELLG